MPLEASRHFGESLLQFLPDMLKLNSETAFEDLVDIPETVTDAIVCYNGALTKNYNYITQLRKLNELQKKEEQEIKEMEELKKKPRKSKGLKRAISFTSLCISGHIFDTKFFNDSLDILETAKANFRIINIK
mmetsp:Transcript_25228/g.27964  ORF Transcript_25228/g.27964 Transcript_25228/m.27964 type:complete len:132 (+) Transcript_25228:1033-1428(+)